MPIILDDYFDDEDRPQQPENDNRQQPQYTGDNDNGQQRRDDEVPEEDFIITNSQRRRRKLRRVALIVAACVIAAILVNVLFISKQAEQGQVRGYIVQMELRKGVIFDSYECTMVIDYPDIVQNDSTLIFRFSATDQAVGTRLSNAMQGDSIVLLDYVRYTTKMPWRGRTDTRVDSVTVMNNPVMRTPSQVSRDKKHLAATKE